MKSILFLCLAFFSLTTISCNKYEEGAAFTLRTRSERVANIWKMENATRNGADVTAEFSTLKLTTTRSGALSQSFEENGTMVELEGQWEFKSNDEEIEMVVSGDRLGIPFESTTLWKIIKLKENELWLDLIDSDTTERWELNPF